MNLGVVFLVAALLLFFLAGVGSAFVPNAVTWGLFCLTLGVLCGGVKLPFPKGP